MRHIDYGLGIFRASALSRISDSPADLASLYQDLVKSNDLAAYEVPDRFYEIGSFQGVRDLELMLRAGRIR
jgi:hypothetical protein